MGVLLHVSVSHGVVDESGEWVYVLLPAAFFLPEGSLSLPSSLLLLSFGSWTSVSLSPFTLPSSELAGSKCEPHGLRRSTTRTW